MKNKKELSLTEGPIFKSLTGFALPILLSLFLQSLYGAVDLLVVGKYATTPDVSGVATGSMVMHTVTMVLTCLAVGVTVVIGREIGRKDPEAAGEAMGSGICLFGCLSVIMTVFMVLSARWWAGIMNAPKAAFEETVEYIRICGCGMLFIIAYNLLGSVFRGIGDSKTPLITVFIASIINIGGDILLVKGFGMGSAGAAYATVAAQGISVLASLIVIKKKQDQIPIDFSRKHIHFNWAVIGTELKIGIPIAVQDLLVGISFMFIQLMVNKMGLVESAAIGVGEKITAFIMLIPSAYSQSLSAFTAQNIGAGKPVRARQGLKVGILTSMCIDLFVMYLAFFHGNMLAGIFSNDSAVIAVAAVYLKAYAIDCMLTPALFCCTGYFNGIGKTMFVMIQGIIGAFCIRIPVVWAVTKFIAEPTLFQVGLATPCTTVVQDIMCIIVLILTVKKEKRSRLTANLFTVRRIDYD